MTVVAICSGGLDSTTLAYRLAAEGHRLHLLGFDYGQRHVRELEFAQATAYRLGATWELADLRGVHHLIAAGALTGGAPVPKGHYAEPSMSATVVPNRNMIMLAVAAGYVVAQGADRLAIGVHAGDHWVYPDCRAPFIQYMGYLIQAGNEGHISPDFKLIAPFQDWSKTDIAAEAHRLGVPVELTWSCYVGGDVHCGRCGTCCERREALEANGGHDPTEYLDRDYWRTALAEYEAP